MATRMRSDGVPAAKRRGPKAEKRESDSLLERLATTNFIFVVGTGISLALTEGGKPSLSWKGLVEDGFDYAVRKGKVTPNQHAHWRGQLESQDLDEIIGAAEFMGRKLGAPLSDVYARWLADVFKDVRPSNVRLAAALKKLAELGVKFATLNYDHLLETVTGLDPICVGDTSHVSEWMRGERQGVLHIHGSWERPSSCVLGIRDYDRIVGDEIRDLLQRSLATLHELVFVGCGDTFADPNFLSLVGWLRQKVGAGLPAHRALILDSQVASRHADPSWLGFVEPVGVGESHADLVSFIEQLAEKKEGSQRGKLAAREVRRPHQVSDYLSFLLRDCGQMTIEGVRADADTAQRRFDLERLYVPLKVTLLPPDIPVTAPDREAKLRAWQDKNSADVSIGRALAKKRGLALLGLPGAGKSMLLKRLATAYADPSRRDSPQENLPAWTITPVLIRCREWRDFIRLPIATLLDKLSEVTGQYALCDLSHALEPLLREGSVLLLVDGLDEIHDDVDRVTFVDNLSSFLAEYPKVRFAITSREAGFSLVAPAVARLCSLWRMAPLDESAIRTLTDNWHSLMNAPGASASDEARQVSDAIVQTAALRRLAENPLLLTMLLVVKQGAGRLPKDRVELYSRAVEVLLNTWNVKGHKPLNPKEAVPQLSYLAYEMMRTGKQTATEEEILHILQTGRDRIPRIKLYAESTPIEFLRQVELRSSLLIEAGKQFEGAKLVPVFQFRHLTFQEYLAAVACVEGHYSEYVSGDSLLVPLGAHLEASEWNEVVPMAAVLARKQAEPLMAALVSAADRLRLQIESDGAPKARNDKKFPVVAKLIEALSQEAEASEHTLDRALATCAYFARGCWPVEEEWRSIAQGPYGQVLLQNAWQLYSSLEWPPFTSARNTVAILGALRRLPSYWESHEGQMSLLEEIISGDEQRCSVGLLTFVGIIWANFEGDFERELANNVLPYAERLLFDERPCVWYAASWAWALIRYYAAEDEFSVPSTEVLDRLVTLWLTKGLPADKELSSFALSTVIGAPRNSWLPILSDVHIRMIREIIAPTEVERRRHPLENHDHLGAIFVAYHSKVVVTDKALAAIIKEVAEEMGADQWKRRMSKIVRELVSAKSKTGR